ncbi:DMT family transporter [Enterovibrio norvegicus]|uniref:DMT family transporter n=1 Tax=Enterovibrio norvegicus TaxID=188144 RepID=UPI00354B17AE
MQWFILFFGIVSNATASSLIKVAVDSGNSLFDINRPWLILTNIPLIAGISLYGLAFILYALALSRLPLNIAHPILTCGSVALVAIISVFFFGESLSKNIVFGLALISAGVALIVQR